MEMRSDPSAFFGPGSWRKMKCAARRLDTRRNFSGSTSRPLASRMRKRELLLDDRSRNRPCRVDVDRDDLRHDLRRVMAPPPNDGGKALDRLVVLDRLDRSGGNVHRDIAIREAETRPREAPRRRCEFARARRSRDVQFAKRLKGDVAGLVETDMRLKAAHRVGQRIIPFVALAVVARKIAFDREATTQSGEGLALCKARPAAIGRDVRVAPRGLGGVARGFRAVFGRRARRPFRFGGGGRSFLPLIGGRRLLVALGAGRGASEKNAENAISATALAKGLRFMRLLGSPAPPAPARRSLI
jgi:hypothetical protein